MKDEPTTSPPITSIQGEKEKRQMEAVENMQKTLGQLVGAMLPGIVQQKLQQAIMPIMASEAELMKTIIEKHSCRDFDMIEKDYNRAVEIIMNARRVKRNG